MIKTKKLLGNECRIKLKEGIDYVANFTKLTLGPKGRNVAFNKLGPLPTRVVNDGVTIAKEVKDDDPLIQAGIEMVQEICEKTNNNAGDGTTQTALLTQAIVEEGQRLVLSGYNAMDVKRELEEDLKQLLEKIDNMSIKVKDTEDIRNIATISGNNDTEIGDAIAGIVEEIGKNASIIIEKGNDYNISFEAVPGLYFDNGYKVPAFINNYKGTAEYETPNIFVVNEKISYNDDIEEFMNSLVSNEIDNVVVFCKEIDGEALATFAITHKQMIMDGNGIHLLVVEAPSVGPDQEDTLNDIAIVTGAKVIGKDTEFSFNEFSKINPDEVKGSCNKIIATSKTTTIIDGRGSKKELDNHINVIKSQIKELKYSEKITREKLEKRRDTLESGVGIVYAGGTTEIDRKDRFLRLEDAVLAVKSAVKEGYLAGGGYTYLKLSEMAHTSILRYSLQSVIKQIAINAGKSPKVVIDTAKVNNVGYNAKTDKFEDMIKAGVIDATLVIKNALQNAVSLAGLFLTTEALIVEYNDDEKAGDRKIKK